MGEPEQVDRMDLSERERGYEAGMQEGLDLRDKLREEIADLRQQLAKAWSVEYVPARDFTSRGAASVDVRDLENAAELLEQTDEDFVNPPTADANREAAADLRRIASHLRGAVSREDHDRVVAALQHVTESEEALRDTLEYRRRERDELLVEVESLRSARGAVEPHEAVKLDDAIRHALTVLGLRGGEDFQTASKAWKALDRLTDRQRGAVDPEQLARRFHETYERLAPEHGYETRKASAVPWEDVPEQNKGLMIAVCAELLRGAVDAPPAAGGRS